MMQKIYVLFSLCALYCFGEDDVWIINATGQPAWVYVTKKGQAGLDEMAKDIKAKLNAQSSMNASGVNITDVYIWPTNVSSPSEDKIRDEAKILNLHVDYKGQKQIFVVQKNGEYKLADRTIVSSNYPDWNSLVGKAEKNGSIESSPWVGSTKQDLISMFAEIPTTGEKIAGWDINNLVPSAYDANKAKVLFQSIGEFLDLHDRKEGWSHFQGIKRLPAWLGLGQYIALNSGQYTNFQAHLFIVKLDSESATECLQGNEGVNHKKDRIIKKIVLGKKPFWHPGGIDICGKYLVVPLASWKVQKDEDIETKTVIYDIENPENPIEVFVLKKKKNVQAVTLTRLPNNYYLLLLRSGRLEFYYSKSTNLADGFFDTPTVSLPKSGILFGGCQNLNFITAGDGSLMMVTTYNTKSTAPIINGEDRADFYEVVYNLKNLELINDSLKNGQPSTINSFDTIAIRRLISKHMFCSDGYGNFSAAADIDIVSQDQINLLTVYHWTDSGTIRMTIF
jgi:hypothetical protein